MLKAKYHLHCTHTSGSSIYLGVNLGGSYDNKEKFANKIWTESTDTETESHELLSGKQITFVKAHH